MAAAQTPSSTRPLLLTALQAPSRLGGLRGGVVGFIAGLAVAGGAGYYLLLGDYDISSRLLQKKVDQIQTSTDEIRDNIQLARRTAQEVTFVKSTMASQKDVADVKTELRDTQDQVEVAQLDIKTRLWELEQEIVALKEQAKTAQRLDAQDPLSIKRK